MQYNSLTLSLYCNGQDYATFLKELKYYLTEVKLTFPNSSKIDEGNVRHRNWSHWYHKIEIHFLHYHTEKEAAEKWYRRVSCVNFDKLILIGMEQKWCLTKNIEDFDNLTYKNKFFYSAEDLKMNSVIYMSEFEGEENVGDAYKNTNLL